MSIVAYAAKRPTGPVSIQKVMLSKTSLFHYSLETHTASHAVWLLKGCR